MSQSRRPLSIVQLYSNDMNIYGDDGNVLTVRRRLQWYGYQSQIHRYNPGDTLPKHVDIVLGGGGQDSGQERIIRDLQAIGPQLRQLADEGTPMLVICGLYQLFGNFFETHSGERLEGIGIFDADTYAKKERLTGNIVTHSDEFGDIVGYENHSGQTFLGEGTQPLASVQLGVGNNPKDTHEGARHHNVIGSYLHGSLLPKNPKIADFLIRHAAIRAYGEFAAMPIDDRITERARAQAMKRSR